MGEGYRATYEVGFWKLVKYLIACLFIGFLAGIIFIVANGPKFIIDLHMANLWLLIPENVVLIGSLAIWNWSRTSSSKKKGHAETAQEYWRRVAEEGDKNE